MQGDRIRFSKMNDKTEDVVTEINKLREKLEWLNSIDLQSRTPQQNAELSRLRKKVIDMTFDNREREEKKEYDFYALGNEISRLNIENDKLKKENEELRLKLNM